MEYHRSRNSADPGRDLTQASLDSPQRQAKTLMWNFHATSLSDLVQFPATSPPPPWRNTRKSRHRMPWQLAQTSNPMLRITRGPARPHPQAASRPSPTSTLRHLALAGPPADKLGEFLCRGPKRTGYLVSSHSMSSHVRSATARSPRLSKQTGSSLSVILRPVGTDGSGNIAGYELGGSLAMLLRGAGGLV